MKKLLFVGLFAIVLFGCTQNTSTCNEPYFEFKSGECCLDKNSNQICDEDEIEEPETSTSETPANKEELAEETALKFARVWESEQWNVMYSMFAIQLKELKSEEEFIKIMNYEETSENIVIRLDDVDVEDEQTAYAYYSVTSGLFDTKAPAMKLVWEENSWKVDAFGKYFLIEELPLSQCSDQNQCTDDLYSFNDKECKNVEFFPCCGNNLCESGESRFGCKVDCFEASFELEEGDSKIVSFLDTDYTITANDFEKKRKNKANMAKTVDILIVNITINGINTIMNEGDRLNVEGNVYLEHKDIYLTINKNLKSAKFGLYNQDYTSK